MFQVIRSIVLLSCWSSFWGVAHSGPGSGKEPETLPVKIPLPVIIGAEGIAVGMSTRILPHNFIEVLEAEQACLRNEEFELYPDFLSGGVTDVSDYRDGNGKILSRALIDSSDPKRIVIRELPWGVTTENLISSVENAAGKLKEVEVKTVATTVRAGLLELNLLSTSLLCHLR